MESDAAATVAEQATDAQLQQLQQLHQALEAAVADADQFFRVNEAFHMQLLALCDNRFLSQVVADLRKVMKLNRHHSLFRQGRIEQSLTEHGSIMKALMARQSKEVAQCMLQHFANGLQAAQSASPA